MISLTELKNVTDRQSYDSSQFLAKKLTKYPITPQTRRYALPCEMFVLKNRNEQELREANFRAGLSH